MPSWRNRYASIGDWLENRELLQKPVVHYIRSVIQNRTSSSEPVSILDFFKASNNFSAMTGDLNTNVAERERLRNIVILTPRMQEAQPIQQVIDDFVLGQERRTWFVPKTTIALECETKGIHYANGILAQFCHLTNSEFPHNLFAALNAHPGSQAYHAARNYRKATQPKVRYANH